MRIVFILFVVDLARTSPAACRFKGLKSSRLRKNLNFTKVGTKVWNLADFSITMK